MAEGRTVKLRTPIDFGSQRIEELTFRTPAGKDFRRLPPDGSSMDVTLILAGRLSGQPDAVIDKLSGDDLWEVMTIVGGFMPGGPATGSTSSQS